jgi:intein/homing endonuclease
MADVCVFPSISEPFGIVSLEAMACLPAGEIVMCRSGPKPIEEIKVGEYVLGKDGNFHKVTHTFCRDFEGELISITPYNFNLPIKFTPEHPILIIRPMFCKKRNNCKPTCNNSKCRRLFYKKYEPEWVPAKDVRENDFVLIPIPQFINDMESIFVHDFIPVIVDNNKCYTLSKNQWRGEFRSDCKPINDEIKLTPNFLKLCGYYIAEGDRGGGRGIGFSFGRHEEAYIEEVKNIIKEGFGLEPYTHPSGGGERVGVYSVILSNLFGKWFGERASEKRLPEWAIHLPFEKVSYILNGMINGDGCLQLDRRKYIVIRYATISKLLAIQTFFLYLRGGVIPELKVRKNKGFKSDSFVNDIYEIRVRLNKRKQYGFIYNGFAWLPVRKVEKIKFKGKVYNLEVDEVNSYACPFIVHNCEKPVVVGARGISGLREQVIPNGENRCGVHINGEDPNDIAWGIKVVLENFEEAKKWGENGRKRVIENFTIEKTAKETLKIYESLI